MSVPRLLMQCNAAMRDVLSAADQTQAVRGFDAETVSMNRSFERDIIPSALNDLLDSLVVRDPPLHLPFNFHFSALIFVPLPLNTRQDSGLYCCICRLAALATHQASGLTVPCRQRLVGQPHISPAYHLGEGPLISASWSMCTCGTESSLELKGAAGVWYELISRHSPCLSAVRPRKHRFSQQGTVLVTTLPMWLDSSPESQKIPKSTHRESRPHVNERTSNRLTEIYR